jgi:hypothetical protein
MPNDTAPRWLHDADALASLAEEPGFVGDWARFQRLARGLDAPLPRSVPWVAPALALLPETRIDSLLDTLASGGDNELGQVYEMLGCGVAPSSPGAWEEGLRARLTVKREGRWAATILAVLGRLTRADLKTVLAHDRIDDLLAGWVLASTPSDELAATAAAMAPDLRDALAGGADRILFTLQLLTPGHPMVGADDPVESARIGARLAGLDHDGPVPKGSRASKARNLALWLTQDPKTPAAHLVRALAQLKDAPPIPGSVIAAVAWERAFHSLHADGSDVLLDVRDRFLRAPIAVREARLAARALSRAPDAQPVVPPDEADDPTLAALALEDLPDDVDAMQDLLTATFGDEDAVQMLHIRTAMAARRPDALLGLFDRPETRHIAVAFARAAPTEGVLERLLQLPIPADAAQRYALAMALVCMGDPATLPNLRAIAAHLERDDLKAIAGFVRSIHNQELQQA